MKSSSAEHRPAKSRGTKPVSNPPRLMESSEFSDVLTKASQRQWSEEHLNERRRAIVSGIAALGTVGAGSAAAKAVGVITKTVAAVATLGGIGTGVYLATDKEPERHAPVTVTATLDAGPGTPARMVPMDATVKTEVDAASPTVEEEQTTRRPRKPAPTKQPDKTSTLTTQLQLIRDAKEAAKQSNYEVALKHLTSLSSRYPTGDLFMEAQLLRLEYLAILNRDQEGLRLVEQLLSRRITSTKKAQLLRLKGDFLLKGGDCEGASAAFRRAIGYGLNEAESKLAQRGLEKCAFQ